uniref:NADH-ubiquinone oxidoreductase chain 4L n=1 Tax=Haemaphysalis flava TaxID=181088 RepID=Q76LQ2_HAEFA|nr:NADH dehydrogenase subunit 4L [Haemaphysalis flava]QAX90628.1 NADH dehydrogenase subunit 4L [Haemaphysalis flava]QPM99860.1 NADH dehydrogenase subunit 4L [Haemaphysalis flava]UNO53829.1 NADH dehydrogenase subunit 4L [Haemaphysalis flava]UXX50247.1 NADH dehydrogenase subunit 4L [Haemaphysalis flava]BAD03993.1 NADH dehydrogenase 4L [Haemaphysalis flava]
MMSMTFFIYFIGVFSFILNRFHLMLLLMSIEFMYLSLMIMFFYNSYLLSILNIFLFLTTIVCEAAIGLSLLVMMSFYYGNELINSFNLIKC